MKHQNKNAGSGQPERSLYFNRGGVDVQNKHTGNHISPVLIGLAVHHLAINYELNCQSKDCNNELLRIHRIFESHPFNMMGIFVLDSETSSHNTFKGPAYSGCGVRVYTKASWQKNKKRPIQLEIYGHGCEQINDDNLLVKLNRFIIDKLSLSKPCTSRIDIALDIANMELSWNLLKRFDVAFPSSRTTPDITKAGRDPLRSIEFGKAGNIQIALYDKKHELSERNINVSALYSSLHPDSSLIRLEARLWRNWLQKRKWRDPQTIIESRCGIMRHIMTYNIIHKGRNGKRSKMWISFLEQLENELPAPEKRSYLHDTKHEAKAICGYGARFSAMLGISDPIEGFRIALSLFTDAGGNWDRLYETKAKQLANK